MTRSKLNKVARVRATGEHNKDGSYKAPEHDKVEDDGTPIKEGNEHSVHFVLPEPKIIKTPKEAREIAEKNSGFISKSYSARVKK